VSTETEKRTALGILVSVSACHLINDMLQSLLPALYPMIARDFSLDFTRIGLLTLSYQLTASVLQPVVGLVTDRKAQPFSLPVGMASTLTGLILLSLADSYAALLAGAMCMGLGSSIFHPEASRVARMASGGRHGLAQSLFQVGGNFGTALGPLLAAFLVLPGGQSSIRQASLAAVLGIMILVRIGMWYLHHQRQPAHRAAAPAAMTAEDKRRVAGVMAVLLVLIFSKYFYLASLSNYYTFYLMEKFQLGVESAQIYLFVFLGAVAAGTIIGGPVGDRIGRRRVIWGSILGVLPFTLALPYASLFWTGVLSVPIGIILASAFPAIVVYGQELVPGRVGTIAGLMFGFAFGMGGIGAAVLGRLADHYGIEWVYSACSFLPALGMLSLFLPEFGRKRQLAAA
jgi:FSR family fosmidomycin resistance protein-like MFS transporter